MIREPSSFRRMESRGAVIGGGKSAAPLTAKMIACESLPPALNASTRPVTGLFVLATGRSTAKSLGKLVLSEVTSLVLMLTQPWAEKAAGALSNQSGETKTLVSDV